MTKKFEIHPSEEFFSSKEDFSPEGPEELEEAKKMAGFTTHEEAMKRLEAREERIKIAEERAEEKDWHNPEDFAFFEKKMEEAEENGEVQVNEKRYINLFAVTGSPKYLDMAVDFLKTKEREISKYSICDAAIQLIYQGKPEFVQTVINLENTSDRARLDDYSREKIVRALLQSGVEPQKAVRYLPSNIPETTPIEKILEATEYAKAYIEGLIKQGNFDKARGLLTAKKDWQYDDLKKEFYFAAGEKKEDLEILAYSKILELLKNNRVDKKAACEVMRKEILREAKEGSAGKSDWPNHLAELIRYSGDSEDIKLAKQTADELLKEIKTEKIALKDLGYINNEGNLFRLDVGLASLELDQETENKILGFLEKLDFSEPEECKGHPERVGDYHYDYRPATIDELLSSVRPDNKRIADFILEKSQSWGDTSYYKRAAYELGEEYQKDRILESLEQEVSRNLEKIKALEGRKGYGYGTEEQELNKTVSKEQNLANWLVFKDYGKTKTEEAYQRVKRIMANPNFGNGDRSFSSLINDLIEQKDYQKIFKFLDDPEINETSRRYLNESKPQNISLLLDHLISSGELDKAKEMVEILGNEPQLVVQIIKELYKRGTAKEKIEKTINDYTAREEDLNRKDNLLFSCYLEVMKLTK